MQNEVTDQCILTHRDGEFDDAPTTLNRVASEGWDLLSCRDDDAMRFSIQSTPGGTDASVRSQRATERYSKMAGTQKPVDDVDLPASDREA